MRHSPITRASPYMLPSSEQCARAAFVRNVRRRYTFTAYQPSLLRRVLNWLDKPFSLTDWR
jgi:hypothetical protein